MAKAVYKDETEKVSNLSAPAKGYTHFFTHFFLIELEKKEDQERLESITQGLKTDTCNSSKAVISESNKLCPLITSTSSSKF